MKYIKKYESRDLPKLKELYKAILIHNNKKVEELINSGMDINQELNIPPWIYGTPLFWAITEDNVKAVKLLLDAGSNPNFKTKEGNCPINIVYNHEMIKYLIDAGADVNVKNEDDETPLQLQSDVKSIKYLIDAGADVNVKDKKGRAPLLKMAQDGKYEAAILLIKAGADINLFDNSTHEVMTKKGIIKTGNAALIITIAQHLGIHPENINLIVELIRAGADIELKDNNGKDFFDYLNDNDKQLILDTFPNNKFIKEKELEILAKKYNI